VNEPKQCQACGGLGKVTCPECNGKGWAIAPDGTVAPCVKEVTCMSCGGTGRQK